LVRARRVLVFGGPQVRQDVAGGGALRGNALAPPMREIEKGCNQSTCVFFVLLCTDTRHAHTPTNCLSLPLFASTSLIDFLRRWQPWQPRRSAQHRPSETWAFSRVHNKPGYPKVSTFETFGPLMQCL
jgi:hypothetical protein